MGEIQELQLQIMEGHGAKDPEGKGVEDGKNQPVISRKSKYTRWLRISVYTVFLLLGQAVASVLTRLYYNNGGKSNWLVTSLQFIGFPILLPFYFLAPKSTFTNPTTQPSTLKLAIIYIPLGLLLTADGLLYSLGLLYLPLSTYALLTSSQLAFNAVFSFFLNAQKFTALIINSLVLLTISSILLVSESNSEHNTNSKSKFVIGFICTIAASAALGLLLSLTQLAFTKVIKQESFRAVMDMIVYQSLVASFAVIIGLFASGDWKKVEREKEEFVLGKVSYAMILVWTTVFWQMFSIGSIGLIFEVSALFSNAISILAVPLAPVLAAVLYHEKMTAVKSMAMVLAIWGLGSYVYQQYLDDLSSKQQAENDGQNSEAYYSDDPLLNL